MKLRTALLAAAAANTLAMGAANAATHTAAHKTHRHAAPSANAELLAQVKALQSEVQSLRGEVEGQKATQTAAVARIDTTESALQSTQTQVAAVQTQIAAQPPVSQEQVNTQIAGAIDKEHHNDKFYFKGITIQPGGFLELAGIYRDHFQGNDISSSFSIPFANNRASHTAEGRFTARQSRLSFLAQGNPNKNVLLSMYGEFDFQGGAQTANSNQSNSYNPRIRNLYATVDWDRGDYGIHFLAGQNWSLATMNSKGITPRNETPPPEVDAQYVPGFVWARQPQVRLTGDFFDHKLWLAVSAENPATITPAGTIPASVTYNQAAGSGFDSANSLSLNHVPDVIGKVAYEANIAGHGLHLEGFGLYRTFSTTLSTGENNSAHGYGFGGGLSFQVVPKVLDIQLSGMDGKGIGRYGTSGLPDVTFSADGKEHAVKEFMVLAGATLHATKMLDLYAYAGEEQEKRKDLGGGYGIGLLSAINSGCDTLGGTCAGNTRRIRQITGGFWDKIYSGSYGKAQVGIVYSYTQRQLFEGVGGEPQASQNMAFVSFRYYPF